MRNEFELMRNELSRIAWYTENAEDMWRVNPLYVITRICHKLIEKRLTIEELAKLNDSELYRFGLGKRSIKFLREFMPVYYMDIAKQEQTKQLKKPLGFWL